MAETHALLATRDVLEQVLKRGGDALYETEYL